MTNRIAVGTPVTVIDRTGNYLNNYGMTHDDLVVLSDANGVGYGVGPSTNDPHKAHSRHGWIYFSKTEVTPKPQESKVTQFKAGDKVEFIEEYMTYASRGTKATVQRNSIGEFTDVRVDSTGETLCPFTRRLKLVEEPAALKVGDKVTFFEESNEYWQGGSGIITSVNPDNRNRYYEIKLIEAPPRNVAYVAGNTVRFPRNNTTVKAFTPFTFKDIQVGDTIRRTAKHSGGATEVREGVVDRKGSYFWANDNFILAYSTDGATSVMDVTLELLNRPEPEPVKEAWEDAKKGDRLVVKASNGATRILTKLKSGSWETLVITPNGSSHIGFTRTDEDLKNQLAQKTYNADGKPQFVKA